MPTRPMVSALWVPAIVQILRQAGWSEGRIARELGLRRDQLGVERRIPLEKYCALLDLVAEVTGDDHFGLRFGATYAFDNASVLGYILRNSPNIGAAIRNAARYVRVHVDGLQLSLMFLHSRRSASGVLAIVCFENRRTVRRSGYRQQALEHHRPTSAAVRSMRRGKRTIAVATAPAARPVWSTALPTRVPA